MNIKMIVAVHEAADVPSDDFYLPVHVGHALKPAELGFQRDDEGENISHLNRIYCELTALYWAWKNLDADVVGLSHYRRFFAGKGVPPRGSKGILDSSGAAELMANHDVVIGTPRNYRIETIESHYRNGHHGPDLDLLRSGIVDITPAYLPAFDQVMRGRKLSLYNMALMHRDAFDSYCEWLFSLLTFTNDLEVAHRPAYQQRVAGYLGERLLNVWVNHHAVDLAVAHQKIVNTEGEARLQKGIGLIQRKLGNNAGNR